MNVVETIEACTGRDLLGWIDYPIQATDRICFPCPHYVLGGSTITGIDASVFPLDGAILARIAAGHNAGTVRQQLGNVAVVRINEHALEENRFFDGEKNLSFYTAPLNPSMGHKSRLELRPLSRTSARSDIIQVIEAVGVPALSGPGCTITPAEPTDIFTDLVCVLVHQGAQDEVWGPFLARRLSDADTILLEADGADFDWRVHRVEAGRIGVHDLTGRTGRVRFRFVCTSSLRTCLHEHATHASLDWLPDEKIADALTKAVSVSAETRDFGKNQMRRIRREIQAIASDAIGIGLDDARRGRLVALAADVEYFSRLPELARDALVENMPHDKLAEIVREPQNLQRFKQQLIDMPEIKQEVDVERERLTKELEGIRANVSLESGRLDAARRELEDTEGALREAKDNLEAIRRKSIEAKNQELAELEARCDALRAEQGDLEGNITKLRADELDLTAALEGVTALIEDKVRLSDAVLAAEVVRRATTLAQRATTGTPGDPEHILCPSLMLSSDTGDELVERLVDVVSERSGRGYERNDVINYCLCLTQGYVTTLCGLPGTGKTSLARLLAQGLGILRPDVGRFVEVSVERGWTSVHDYVGYFNPLTQTEEHANPEVFSALELLSQECQADPSTVAPCVFLLDEANLSPIEHYWSPFLRACDSFDRHALSLAIGGTRSLLVPSHTRFVCTVNYDHTTEELSPRFLDRSWTIMLTPDTMPEDYLTPIDDAADLSLDPISYKSLIDTFGRQHQPAIDEAALDTLTKIMGVCRSHKRPVSPRSRNMLVGYIAAASRLMDTAGASGAFAPVDFAVAQKVLPQLSGPAEQLGPLIDLLTAACARLPRTTALLEDMRATGEANGYYQFFA